MTHRIAVIGASGFVGSAVTAELITAGHQLVRVPAPRVRSTARSVESAMREASGLATYFSRYVSGCDVVINAAGLATALSSEADRLVGANAVTPLAAAIATADARIPRFVHVSSAAVQGRSRTLDEAPRYEPLTAYAESKTLAERALLAMPFAGTELCIFRATSVHGKEREITRKLVKFLQHRFAPCGPPSEPTPQALIENTAAAIATLSTSRSSPPNIVLQPDENLTCGELALLARRGRPGILVPPLVSRPLINLSMTLAQSHGLRATIRRAEILLLGQGQTTSWLTDQGFTIPSGREGWIELFSSFRQD